MNELPLVTVCVPSYNQRTYIAATLDSILAQDYRPLQIIVADDGSTDGTADIVRDYAARYPQEIEALVHPGNIGLNANLASLQARISGTYLSWFAGDDLMLPGKLQAQVKLLQQRPELVFCYHDLEVLADNGRSYLLPATPEVTAEQLMTTASGVPTLSLLINRQLAADIAHRQDSSLSSDWLLLIELAIRGPGAYLPGSYVRYHRHTNNISKKVELADDLRIYDLIEKRYPELVDLCLKGRAVMTLSYVFKYALQLRWAAGAQALFVLLPMLGRRPALLPFLLIQLSKRLWGRLKMWQQTGQFKR